jgi:type IV pilus assembly protein PilQ
MIAWGFACGPVDRVNRTDTSENRDVTSPKMITDIVTTDEIDGVGILLKSDRLLTATSIKQPYPLGVILYLPETVAPDLQTIYTPDSDIIKSIKATKLTDDGPGVRLEILLEKEVPYDIIQQEEGLKVVFKEKEIDDASSSTLYGEPGKAPQSFEESDIQPIVEPEQPARSTVNNIRTVSATELDKSVNITVQAEGAIKNYSSSTMASPARIVFEMFNVKSPHQREQTVPVNTEWVKAVRYYSYPDRVRLVLETDKKYLNNFSAYSTDNGLLINVGSAKSPLASKNSGASEKTASQTLSSDSPTPQPETVRGKKKYGRAWVNRIDFHSTAEGRSSITIGTTRPVRYDVNKQGAKQLKISLFSTQIPKHRRRPLITTRFESAVDRITPKQRSGATDITILLREAVPYNVEQEGNLLKITLEASAIPPKPSAAAASVALKDNTDSMVLNKADDKVSSATETTQKYVGEKISLDFYQTDIKNVFRILREVSKRNFAIDDDVTGQVTLTLDKPVPWDQVLELILKMNSLSMVYEGNIIRIAKLSTLAEAEKIRNKAIKEAFKARESSKALEPLETVYIPINYVKTASMLAQITPILTPSRGIALIHEETHQIVLTDVPEVIQKVRGIIANLDLITQQVLIEARVVEVSSLFDRSIGIRWQAMGGIEPPIGTVAPGYPGTSPRAGIGPQKGFNDLGGTYGYSMISQNAPILEAGTIGFNFTRLIASEFLLGATLKALEDTGTGKIISSPKVLTLDGVQAVIKQGDAIPYRVFSEGGGYTVEWKEIILQLSVTPQITRDHRVRLLIDLINNVPKTFGDVIGSTNDQVKTELLVNDGDTIVIGGIIKFEENISTTSIPWLSDIPVLGWLFKEERKRGATKEILIFITPTIVTLDQPKIQNL